MTVEVTLCHELIEVGTLSDTIWLKSTMAAGGRSRLRSAVGARPSIMRTIVGSAYIFAILRLELCWNKGVVGKAVVFENILDQMEDIYVCYFSRPLTRKHLDLMYTSMLLTENS